MMLFILPMWINFLLRTYGWMTLLENNGIINKIFGTIGLGQFQLINNKFAVIVGMVYNYLPFMILCSIFSGLFTGLCAQVLVNRGKDIWKTVFK